MEGEKEETPLESINADITQEDSVNSVSDSQETCASGQQSSTLREDFQDSGSSEANLNWKSEVLECSNCKTELGRKQKFCFECGERVENITNPIQEECRELVCSDCKSELGPQHKFCFECGKKVQEIISIPTQERNVSDRPDLGSSEQKINVVVVGSEIIDAKHVTVLEENLDPNVKAGGNFQELCPPGNTVVNEKKSVKSNPDIRDFENIPDIELTEAEITVISEFLENETKDVDTLVGQIDQSKLDVEQNASNENRDVDDGKQNDGGEKPNDKKRNDNEEEEIDNEEKQNDVEKKKIDDMEKKTDGEDKKIDGEGKKIDGEEKMIDDEEKKTDDEGKKSDGEDKMTDDEDKKTDGEDKKTDDEDKKTDDEDKKTDGGDKKSDGEDKKSDDEDKKSDCEEKKTDGGDKKSDGGDKKSDGEDKKNDGGDKKTDGGDKKSDGEDKKTDGEDKKIDGGDKKSDDEDKKTDDQDKKIDGGDKKSDGEEKKTDGEDKKIDGGDKKSDGEDKKSDGEDKKSDGGDKKADGEVKKTDGGDKKFDGEDKKTDGGDKKSDGEDKKTASGDKKTDGGDKKSDGEDKKSDGGDKKTDGVDKKTDGEETRTDDSSHKENENKRIKEGGEKNKAMEEGKKKTILEVATGTQDPLSASNQSEEQGGTLYQKPPLTPETGKKKKKRKGDVKKQPQKNSTANTPMKTLTVVFHAILSNKFKREDWTQIVIRGEEPLFGGWNKDGIPVSTEEFNDGQLLVRSEFRFPLKYTYLKSAYKYVLLNKKDKAIYEELVEFTVWRSYVNRCLVVPQEYAAENKIYHKYDGFIYPKPSTWKLLFPSGSSPVDNRRTFFREYFPKWSGFFVNLSTSDSKIQPIEALQRLRSLVDETSTVWISISNCPYSRFIESSKLRLSELFEEILMPKIEKNLEVLKSETTDVNAQVDAVVSSVIIVHVFTEYFVYLKPEQCEIILKCLILPQRVEVCSEFMKIINGFDNNVLRQV